jgi:TPR repeat protein
MASLTPLSKGLIGLAVVGAMASAVWHLVLKERMGGEASAEWQAAPTSATPTLNAAQPTPAPANPTPAVATPNVPNTAVTAPNGNLSAAENFDLGRRLMASGDFVQARKHLEAAVNAGDGAAACLLGEMTLKGQGGITANQDASAKLFQLAQSRGSICFATGQ